MLHGYVTVVSFVAVLTNTDASYSSISNPPPPSHFLPQLSFQL